MQDLGTKIGAEFKSHRLRIEDLETSVSALPTGAMITTTEFAATAGQTVFTTDYTVNFVDVHLNGLELSSSDYVATTGTEIVLNVGANVGDIVSVKVYSTIQVLDTYTQAEMDAALVLKANSADTYTKTAVDNALILKANSSDVTTALAGKLNSTNPSIVGGITETVYNLTGTSIVASNGTVQYKTLSGVTTLTESLTSGQFVILRLVNGASYAVTFPSAKWTGGTVPTLTAEDAIVFWKEGTQLFASYLGTLVQA